MGRAVGEEKGKRPSFWDPFGLVCSFSLSFFLFTPSSPLGHHEWLLGPEVDILPFLLLPLAGPEEFSEEEMDRE